MYLVVSENVILKNDEELHNYFQLNVLDNLNYNQYCKETFVDWELECYSKDELYDAFYEDSFYGWYDEQVKEVEFYYD